MAVLPNPLDPVPNLVLQHFHAEMVPGLMDIELQLGQWYAQLLQWYDSHLCDIKHHSLGFWDQALTEWATRLNTTEQFVDNLFAQLGPGFDKGQCQSPQDSSLAGQSIVGAADCPLPNNIRPDTGQPYCPEGWSPVSVDINENATCDLNSKYDRCDFGVAQSSTTPPTTQPPTSGTGCTLVEQVFRPDPQATWDDFGYDIAYRDWSGVVPFAGYLVNGKGEIVSGARLNADWSITIPGNRTYKPSWANYTLFADGNSEVNKTIQDSSEGSPLWLCNHPLGTTTIPPMTIPPTSPPIGTPLPPTSPPTIIAGPGCDIQCPQPIVNVACNPTPINVAAPVVNVTVNTGSVNVPPTTTITTQQAPTQPLTCPPPVINVDCSKGGETAIGEEDWDPPVEDFVEQVLDDMGFKRAFVEFFAGKAKQINYGMNEPDDYTKSENIFT